MIPVVLLAKCSVFEMRWLESDIQQTNGTFAFCQCYRHCWLKKLMKTGVQQGFLAVCNFVSMLQCEADLAVLFTFCLPVL